jgi:hypothetical protein
MAIAASGSGSRFSFPLLLVATFQVPALKSKSRQPQIEARCAWSPAAARVQNTPVV